MSVYYVSLKYTPSRKWMCLRNLCGHDEMAAGNTGVMGAIQLIDRLTVSSPELARDTGKAREIVTADRDRLLAYVYQNTFGAKIESTIDCQDCKESFDLSFSLQDLLQYMENGNEDIQIEMDENGTFKLENGLRFRLPTGEDECAVLDLSPELAARQLMKRCLLKGDPKSDAESVQKAMEKIAPMLTREMAAYCPDCNHLQTVHFDIQSYLLSTLRQEQKLLTLEVHRLAMAYGWSLNEILELPRNLRKAHVALVEENDM